MPRVRFTIRQMIAIVGLLAIGFAYVRRASQEYAAFVSIAQNDVSAAADAAYEREQRLLLIRSLVMPPAFVAIFVAAGFVAYRQSQRTSPPLDSSPCLGQRDETEEVCVE